MPRTSAARKPEPLQLPQVQIGDWDRWRAARTGTAHSIVGYTPIDQLYEDYCRWSATALGHDAPDPASFRACFENAPKPLIKTEVLPCRVYYQVPRNTECASLTLVEPLQVRR